MYVIGDSTAGRPKSRSRSRSRSIYGRILPCPLPLPIPRNSQLQVQPHSERSAVQSITCSSPLPSVAAPLGKTCESRIFLPRPAACRPHFILISLFPRLSNPPIFLPAPSDRRPAWSSLLLDLPASLVSQPSLPPAAARLLLTVADGTTPAWHVCIIQATHRLIDNFVIASPSRLPLTEPTYFRLLLPLVSAHPLRRL